MKARRSGGPGVSNMSFDKVNRYAEEHGEAAESLTAALERRLPEGWDSDLPRFTPQDKAPATRAASAQALNAIAKRVPWLIGGSADLAESNLTMIHDAESFQQGSYAGRNLHFGVREHAMGSIMNGMAVHGGVRPYGGTFLIFSDYMRPSIRLAAVRRCISVVIQCIDRTLQLRRRTGQALGYAELFPQFAQLRHVLGPQANIQVPPNLSDKRFPELYLIPAAQTRDKMAVSPSDMVLVCDQLRQDTDYIVIDSPAGIERSADAFRALIDLAIARGGSYFLTYHRWARPDQVAACYPQFDEFLRLKREHDPHERFQSEWYRHARGLRGHA